MTPDDETLELCKLLPQPNFHDLDLHSVIQLQDEIFNGDFVVVTGKHEGRVTVLNGHFATDYGKDGNYPNFILIPHPHQIMALKKWQDNCSHLALHFDGNFWSLREHEDGDDADPWGWYNHMNTSPTARLACLRAIAPFLQGGDGE